MEDRSSHVRSFNGNEQDGEAPGKGESERAQSRLVVRERLSLSSRAFCVCFNSSRRSYNAEA